MLCACGESRFTEQDEFLFRTIVPSDHILRTISASIDFEAFHQSLAHLYDLKQGRPGDPVKMVKVVFLQFFYTLSDAQVIARAQTDMAMRWFLGLSIDDAPPNPSNLSYFRSRLKVEGTQALLSSLIQQAQEHGLIKYRLRLKDATHVVANIAIKATLPLVAEIREKLLSAARPFAPEQVTATEARLVEVRAATNGRDDAVRLASRVEMLRDILLWANEMKRPEDADEKSWTHFEQARDLLQKMLTDAESPDAGDRVLSAQDPDARRGKHGVFYDGYMVDVLMDADSELITALNVLPANGYEGLDAVTLVEQEERVTGEDVKAISIDGAGSPGEVVRALENPNGLGLDVYVPPQPTPDSGDLFPPSKFVEDAERKTATCPAGETSQSSSYDKNRQSKTYIFKAATCSSCPLLNKCMKKPPQATGRTVRKTDYEKEYQATRAKAATEEYKAVKKEHPKIERKLSELINRHSARYARYRGLLKVLCQQLWIAIAVNIKRIVKLRSGVSAATACPAIT